MPEQGAPVGGNGSPRLPLRSISHSRYELLRLCELRAVLSAGHGQGDASVSSVLGRIAHTALELLARRSPTPLLERPPTAAIGRICDDAWDEAEKFESRKREVSRLIEVSGPPASWSQYHERKLALVRLFHLTAEWLGSIGAHGDLLPEEELTSPEGDIYGKLDLLVRGVPGAVLDYKTGAVLADGLLKREIREQLSLYAWLEAQVAGDWPRFLAVVPREGPIIGWEVTAEVRREASSVVGAMRQALAVWNSRLDAPGVGSPSPDGCTYCPFKHDCLPFWEAAPTWMASPAVAEVEVTGSRQLGAGGVMYLVRPIRSTRELDNTKFLRARDGRPVPLALVEAEAQRGFPFAAVVDGFIQRGSVLDLASWSTVVVTS